MKRKTDGVIPRVSKVAIEYGKRCEAIAAKHRIPEHVDDAMGHPEFTQRHHQLLNQLARERGLIKDIANRKIWRTIQIGNEPYDELWQALDAEEGIGDYGEGILEHLKHEHVKIARTTTGLDLIVVTEAQLGFEHGCRDWLHVFHKAMTLGLRPCPPEVGIALRHQSIERHDEWLCIGIRPHDDAFLGLHHCDGRWQLSAFSEFFVKNYPSGRTRWVFVLPRKEA